MYESTDALYGTEDFAAPPALEADLVVALGQATVNGVTQFGLNSHRQANRSQSLVSSPAREHALGEVIRTPQGPLPQVRHTLATLGCQVDGAWGYLYGVNERQVAAGCSSWQSLLPPGDPGLAATDLVRLALERSTTASQAVDVLTGFITRFGQRGASSAVAQTDHVFLLADAREAFVIEAADRYWALQEIRSVRAVTDLSVIRQDWDRISCGLADQAITRGWWQADGSKLDFAASLVSDPVGPCSALRRWGRATILLESESGRIDAATVRRILGDHYEGTRFEVDPASDAAGPVPLCRHACPPRHLGTATSFHVELADRPHGLVTAWAAFGPPCVSVYLPLFVLAGSDGVSLRPGESPYGCVTLGQMFGELHQVLGRDAGTWRQVRERFAGLQARIDEEAQEFQQEAASLLENNNRAEVQRLAGFVLQSHLELCDGIAQEVLAHAAGATLVG
jgi:secernin